jgi:hypothetical protein
MPAKILGRIPCGRMSGVELEAIWQQARTNSTLDNNTNRTVSLRPHGSTSFPP